jgi:hypothetical protein
MPSIDEFPFHNSINKALNDRNRARFLKGIAPRTPQTERAPIKVLELLLEFSKEKIHKTIRDGNRTQGLKAFCELEDVLRSLICFGFKEFEETLRQFDAAWARLLVATRVRLVRDYLDPSTPNEEAQQIHAMLCEIIERGAWPNWEEEYEAAVQEACTPSIVPLRTG